MSHLPPVLLVDDRADDRELLGLVLRGAFGAVDIEEAPDAASLARAMTTARCGLVVAEHDLPWIRGADLVRLVRDLRPGVPMVILTGRPLGEVAAELIHLAPDAVVTKTSAGLADLPRVLGRLLAEAERRRNAALPGRGAEIEEMAYVVTHDLRQPLHQVARALDMLTAGEGKAGGEGGKGEGGKGAAERAELLALAQRGARRLETLLDGITAYARVDGQGGSGPVPLEPLFQRVLDRLAEDRAAAEAEVTHDPLPTVEGSAPQLEQLFQNLLGNAFKFRGKKPARVHVGAAAEDGMWHLTFRDHGIGIEPKDRDRIFGLFQRLHTEGEIPGSGIGLALCRRIVARHGGRIWVESTPGEGATFHVTLERQPDARAAGED